MVRLGSLLVSALLVVVLLVSGGQSQEKKDPPAKKPQMPANTAKLGLSEEQKGKIRDILVKYAAKRDELKRQLDELKEAETAEWLKVLTEAQREQYRKILLKGIGEDKKKAGTDKKADKTDK